MVSGGWVVAGLGNPGPRYSKTRHNAGFLLLDALAQLSVSAPRWRTQFKAETLSITSQEQELFLIKPQTFMNLSGEAVAECLGFRKIPPNRLVVVHDEIDIPFGEIRIKKGGGSGGHNGLKSVTERLATPDYFRIRLGIGRPEDQGDSDASRHADVSAYVLANFSASQGAELPGLLEQGCRVLEALIGKGLTEALARCSRRG